MGEETEENHDKPKSGSRLLGRNLEPGLPQHGATFGVCFESKNVS